MNSVYCRSSSRAFTARRARCSSACPLGLFTAVFLAKAAPPRIAAAARSCVALLAGIPSVVYGLVGMTVLVPFVQKTFSLSSGACLFTAILVLTV